MIYSLRIWASALFDFVNSIYWYNLKTANSRFVIFNFYFKFTKLRPCGKRGARRGLVCGMQEYKERSKYAKCFRDFNPLWVTPYYCLFSLQNGKENHLFVLVRNCQQILCFLSPFNALKVFPQFSHLTWIWVITGRNSDSFLALQEFQNQQIEDNDKIPSARIPINFDEFGKPLEELEKCPSNELVPQIVVNIIENIKQLSK